MINLSEAETLDFKVIVNSANSDTVLTRDMISKIFLKKIKRWETSEEKIMPVDLVDDSSIRESFSEIILDKKISSVKAYWQKQIFSGRGVPPPEKKNDKEVLEYVDENEGAIGYVSQNAKIGKYDVTVVEIED
jgi:ABC-type phosphate transport system substrate-binding protein